MPARKKKNNLSPMDYIMSLPLGEVGYERLIIRPKKKKTLRILRSENGKKVVIITEGR